MRIDMDLHRKMLVHYLDGLVDDFNLVNVGVLLTCDRFSPRTHPSESPTSGFFCCNLSNVLLMLQSLTHFVIFCENPAIRV